MYVPISNFCWHCHMQWVVQGAVDVDIGANPSAEGADEGEGVDDQSVKVVDIVDTFRLQVFKTFGFLLNEEIFDIMHIMFTLAIYRNNHHMTRSSSSHTLSD